MNELGTSHTPGRADVNIASVDEAAGTIKNGGGTDIETSENVNRIVGWTPHKHYPLIISFDQPGLLTDASEHVVSQTFGILPCGDTEPVNTEYIFGGILGVHYYTAILVTGANTYVTLNGPPLPKGDVSPRRPRILVGVKLDESND